MKNSERENQGKGEVAHQSSKTGARDNNTDTCLPHTSPMHVRNLNDKSTQIEDPLLEEKGKAMMKGLGVTVTESGVHVLTATVQLKIPL